MSLLNANNTNLWECALKGRSNLSFNIALKLALYAILQDAGTTGLKLFRVKLLLQ